jgi:anti-sigma regulatory factor (Ser/Thr protein kinase)
MGQSSGLAIGAVRLASPRRWVAPTGAPAYMVGADWREVIGVRRQLDIPISPRAAREARRLVTEACSDVATELELEDILLLTSELVTNAIRHALMIEGDILTLVVDVGAGRARISVRDPGPGFSQSDAGGPASDLGTGWGLRLVEALSDAWGVRREPDGFSVWADVGLNG